MTIPMPNTIDIKAALAKLTAVHNPKSDTSSSEIEAAFTFLTSYRDGVVSVGSFSGTNEWERHQSGDEVVHVMAGATTITIMRADGPDSFELTEGTMIVVPKGHWHRFTSPHGVQILAVTPQPTVHLPDDDPASIELSAKCYKPKT